MIRLLILFAALLALSWGKCPQNSLHLDDPTICYSFHRKLSTFAKAQSHCKSFGAALVSLKNEYVNVFITDFSRQIFDDSLFYWSSGNRLSTPNFQWADGVSFGYTHFRADEKDKNGSCLSVELTQGFWRAENCFAEFSFVCEFGDGKGITPTEAEYFQLDNSTDVTEATTTEEPFGLLSREPTTSPQPPTIFQTEQPTTISLQPFCESGWELYEGNCYKIGPQEKWENAEKSCQKDNSNLASIHSKEENDFIADFGDKSISPPNCRWEHQLWVGFNNVTVASYEWTDGTPKDYVNWLSNEPDNEFHSEKCGQINVNRNCTKFGGWNDFRCREKLHFVCKKKAQYEFSKRDKTESPSPFAETSPSIDPDFYEFSQTSPQPTNEAATDAPTTVESLTCPEGWEMFNKNCYKLLSHKSWNDGEAECQKQGAHLASIHSQEENDFIAEFAQSAQNESNSNTCAWEDQLWIGFNKNENSSYVWADESSSDYIKWDVDEPNDHIHKENCALMYLFECKNRTIGAWNDFYCNKNLRPICKKSAGKEAIAHTDLPSTVFKVEPTTPEATTIPPNPSQKRSPGVIKIDTTIYNRP